MSFILDALRKSEHERERRALPGLVESKIARDAPSTLAWVLGGFGVLLVLNGAILAYLLLRPAPAPAPAAGAATAASVAPVAAATSARATPPTAVDETGRVRPLAGEVADAELAPDVPEPPPVAHPATTGRVATPAPAPAPAPLGGPAWPTLRQLPASEAAALPPLNLDLHVYSSVAAQRFVIINGQRAREGGQLREGLVVEQITPDGALLNHQGRRFLLTRD